MVISSTEQSGEKKPELQVHDSSSSILHFPLPEQLDLVQFASFIWEISLERILKIYICFSYSNGKLSSYFWLIEAI